MKALAMVTIRNCFSLAIRKILHQDDKYCLIESFLRIFSLLKVKTSGMDKMQGKFWLRWFLEFVITSKAFFGLDIGQISWDNIVQNHDLFVNMLTIYIDIHYSHYSI